MTNFLDKDRFFFFFFSRLFRNRRSGQNDRLSGVSVALHYGSESEDDAVLSGQYELLKVKRNSPPLVSYLNVSMFSGSVCYDEGESEAESQSSSMEMSNPIFQLYEAVRGARNNQGQVFSEPFQQLPSRREYPDYYQQIKQPIALQQIR